MDTAPPGARNGGCPVTSVLELVASSRGGGAVHVRELTGLLDRTRLSVQVAMPEDGGHVTAADFTGHGVPFHRLDIASGPSLKAIRELRSLLSEQRFDILHCHGARAAFYGRLAAALVGKGRPKIVYSIHGFAAPHYALPRRSILLGIERFLAPFTDAVICVSAAERQSFVAAGLGPPERLHLVRYGIDAVRFRDVLVDQVEQRTALGVPLGASLITTICRLYRPRDFETLLSAFAKVRAELPTAHLLIVGDGPYREQIESLVKDLDIMPHVTMAGFRRDTPKVLATSDIFVLSTAMWEGLPLTILEAMASGLPVVASDVGGIREEIVDHETGIVVPPKNPTVLFESLLSLLANKSKARAMGQRGQERVFEYFTLERMGRETMAVYEGLTGQS
jgi:glycosyltransferase involved in cell wall biosynthesis